MTDPTPPTRRFFSSRFIACAVMLIGMAALLRPAIAALTRHYDKQPIVLKLTLDDLTADDLPSFRDPEGRLSLGLGPGDVETEDVIAPVFELEELRGDEAVRQQVMLFVTYYSDPRNRIAHTPEVCYRQSGAVISAMRTTPLDIPELSDEHGTIIARELDIDSYGRRSALVYVFSCNGRFFHDREAVRFAIAWPGDAYTYFSKVEAVTTYRTDEEYDEAIARCKKLLAEALPVLVERHYPGRADVARQ
jgi:hypothetical protein